MGVPAMAGLAGAVLVAACARPASEACGLLIDLAGKNNYQTALPRLAVRMWVSAISVRFSGVKLHIKGASATTLPAI